MKRNDLESIIFENFVMVQNTYAERQWHLLIKISFKKALLYISLSTLIFILNTYRQDFQFFFQFEFI